jgi:ferredoxin
MHDDGLAYVKEVDDSSGLAQNGQPTYQMAEGMANVPEELIESVIEAAEECPGECIFIEGGD